MSEFVFSPMGGCVRVDDVQLLTLFLKGVDMHDPCDDCSNWVGELPAVDNCICCEAKFSKWGRDVHMHSSCPDCADDYRDEHALSTCCHASLDTRVVGASENGDEINDEFYYCSRCNETQD